MPDVPFRTDSPCGSGDSLVFRALSADRRASGADDLDRQDLPQLDLLGAAIARAARLAAAEDRARRALAFVQRTQAAELLRAARDAARAAHSAPQRARAPLFADLATPADSVDGRVIPATAHAGGFVWRFHAAPAGAGAAIALRNDGALA